ncbi:MAG: DUF6268 family outer membrane beta-barrel protein [Syntrophales bacterium]|nr:DUF6268 family outer membrane beta-barrel protein [Syntrophales bacterium]
MHDSKRLPILKDIWKPAGWALLIFFILLPTNIFGQMASPVTIDGNARFSASASSSYQFKSNLDGGGDVSIARYGVGVGGMAPLTDRTGLGFRMSYDREDYNFSNTNGFHIQNPWSQVNRLGLGMRLGYKLTDQWSIGAGPVVQHAGESGAKFSDSLMYGGIASAVYRVNPDLLIGFGAGVFYRLEETRVFPSLIVSWKINDRLHLGNSYRLGATGPAGLELSYKLDKNWETAVGGGHRSSRFRLDKDGSTPDGIGENSSWPVYARLSRKLGSVLHLDLYGGAVFGGKMKLQDSSGNDIRSVNYDTTPLLGVNLRAGF